MTGDDAKKILMDLMFLCSNSLANIPDLTKSAEYNRGKKAGYAQVLRFLDKAVHSPEGRPTIICPHCKRAALARPFCENCGGKLNWK